MENKLKQRLAAGEVSLCMGLRQARTVDIGPLVGAAGIQTTAPAEAHSAAGQDQTDICRANQIHENARRKRLRVR